MLQKSLSGRQLFIIELFIILFFCFIPLAFNNPYRINIFLSWEGAYRMYLGQMPFRDFSMPMGYGYWVIPALFFKIFGPYFYTLIKAQVLVNLISVFTFRSILKILDVRPVVILLSVLVYCFSYVSFNFWPWYNNMVIAFELVAIYFTLVAIFTPGGWKMWASLVLAGFFAFFAIWTKQDAGGLGLLIIYGMLTYNAWIDRSLKKWLAFTGFVVIFAIAFVAPIYQYDFAYWYNYGQPPHKSRIVLMNFLNEILGWAYWEKFFLLAIVLFVLDKARAGRAFFKDRKEVLFAFLCISIILQAWIIPVTSPVPERNEVFFYGFGFAYLLSNLRLGLDLSRWYYLAICLFLTTFWWTGIYWRNIARVISKKPSVVQHSEEKASHQYRLAKEYKTMERLFLAESTLDGIRKIKELDVVKNKKNLRVLNMSELTSLANEIPFTPPINQPMWYHQTVAIFQEQVDEFCEKIRRKEFDLVIFETVSPKEAINFFPMDVKECLMEHYKHEFTFLAPRHPEESFIDVFTLPAGEGNDAAGRPDTVQ